MSDKLRVAVLADCHIDHNIHGMNAYDAWDSACRWIRDSEIPLTIILGDMYHKALVTGYAACKGADGIKTITDGGGEVIVVAGNHEWLGARPATDRTLTIESFSHIPRVSVATTPTIYTAGEIKVVTLPWTPEGFPGVPTPEVAADQAADIIASKNISGPRMAVAHWMVGGAKTIIRGSEIELASLTKEHAVPLASIDQPEAFTRTVLGHIHRRQSLSDTCGYVGSMEQMCFADEGQVKGFSLFEWDDSVQAWSEKHIPIGRRNFYTLGVDEDFEQMQPGSHIQVIVEAKESADPRIKTKIADAGCIFHDWKWAADTRKVTKEQGATEGTEEYAQMSGEVPGIMPWDEVFDVWLPSSNVPDEEKSNVAKYVYEKYSWGDGTFKPLPDIDSDVNPNSNETTPVLGEVEITKQESLTESIQAIPLAPTLPKDVSATISGGGVSKETPSEVPPQTKSFSSMISSLGNDSSQQEAIDNLE